MALALAIGAAAPAAADPVLVRDTHVGAIYALGGAVLYQRARPGGGSTFVRWVDGRARRARGIPPGASASAIGRDRAGRVVMTMATSRGWWIYDVRSDRARRLRGVPRHHCDVTSVAVWRATLAYMATTCIRGGVLRGGLFLRDRGHRRNFASFTPGTRFVLRGHTLAWIWDDGTGNTAVVLQVEGGRVCDSVRGSGLFIADSGLPPETPTLGLWLRGRTLMWWVQPKLPASEPGALVGTRLAGRCAPPGPVSPFATPRLPADSRGHGLAVDGRWLYYGDARGLRRRRLPAAPLTAPPTNDDFRHAAPLRGDPPLSVTETIGNATPQPGDPAFFGALARTVWFAFLPAASQTVRVSAALWPDMRAGVFTGSDIRSLTLLGSLAAPLDLDVQGGRSYRIGVSCFVFYECGLPFQLRIEALAQAGGAKPPSLP